MRPLLIWCLLICLGSGAYAVDYQEPQLYLEEKLDALLAADASLDLIQVEQVTDDWYFVEGDSYPYQVVTSHVIEKLAGADVGTEVKLGVFQGRPCPGQRYVVFAMRQGAQWKMDSVPAHWLAFGLPPLRDKDADAYFWDAPTGMGEDVLHERPARAYRLADLRRWVHDHPVPLPLSQVQDQGVLLGKVRARVEHPPTSPDADLLDALDRLLQGESAYRSMGLLRDLGLRPAWRDAVLERSRKALSLPDKRLTLAAASALAELGSADGQTVLKAALESSGSPLSQTGSTMTPGEFQYDTERANLSAAYYLGLLGDDTAIKDSDTELRLAAASGLVVSHPEALQAAIGPLFDMDEATVEGMRKAGHLSLPRREGELTDRLPRTWIKEASLLARAGSDAHLKLLVDAWLEDLDTYPKHQDLSGRLIMTEGTPHSEAWPSLSHAILSASPDRSKVLERLRKLYQSGSAWNGPGLQSLRTALGDNTLAASKPVEPDHRAEVRRLLNTRVGRDREEGLVAAGRFGYPEFYAEVLHAALTQLDDNGAAIYSLGLYRRPIDLETARKLLHIGPVLRRLAALELVTRNHPERFEPETWDLVQTLPTNRSGLEGYHITRYVILVLSRLFRTRPPSDSREAGLSTPVRSWVLTALVESGNPAALQGLPPEAPHHADTPRHEPFDRLGEAIKNDAIDDVKRLLDEFPELVDEVEDGPTRAWGPPLNAAIYRQRPRIIELLLERRADPQRKGNSGETSLWVAAEVGNCKLMPTLLKDGVAIDESLTSGPYRLYTPLHVAVLEGQAAAVELLLSNGAHVNLRNADGETPLSIALNHGKYRIHGDPATVQRILDLLRSHGGTE